MLVSSEMRPYFRAAAILGVLLLAGDMLWSAKFGWTISAEASVIVAAISLASGILPVVGWFFHRAGHRGVATAILTAWALAAFPFNIYSNMGVSTANRMGEVQKASVQQTTYTERQKAVSEAEDRLKLFTANLERLTTENAWAANVTAEALREQSAGLAQAIEQEGSPRNGGCKRKCLDLMAKKDAIDGQIGVVETRVDLTKQIDATKKVLETARAELAKTDAGISATANQSSLYAKVVNWDLGGDPSDRSINVANEITGIATAFVLAILAAITTLAGAYPALMKVGRITVNAREITVDGNEPEADRPGSVNSYKYDAAHSNSMARAADGAKNFFSINTNEGLAELAAAIRRAQEQRAIA